MDNPFHKPWTTSDPSLIHDRNETDNAGITTMWFKKVLSLRDSQALVADTNAKIRELQDFDAAAEIAKKEAENLAKIAELEAKIAPVEEKLNLIN